MKNISDFKKFASLSTWKDEELTAFLKYFEEKKFKTNEIVVAESTEGQEVYLLVEGKVRVEREVMGEEQTLKILEKGEFFGEMSLFDNYPRSATVRCFEDARLLLMNKNNWEKLRKDNPKVAMNFLQLIIQTLSMRLRQTNKNLEILSLWLV
ncbi:cyclic nucleotide-binding domain-containing protein [bacterium]|nr:cyclic nucleotide-binding domain-containing protein [bacterium]